jgi:hypothetical protein
MQVMAKGDEVAIVDVVAIETMVVVVVVVVRRVCVLQCGVCLCARDGVVGAQIVEAKWLVPAAVLSKGE